MLLSLNWLKEYVKIPRGLCPRELGEKLTMHTVEIDGVEDQASRFKNFTVGRILEIRKHPNADRLQIALVDAGSKSEKPLNIVCGAPNIKVGQAVPVALEGAELPNGLQISRTKVRGEYSEGMLCAEDELGMGENHEGIMILPEEAKPGAELADFLGFKDTIFEVDNKSITNRPDLWGHLGYARELSAFLGVKTTEKFKEIVRSSADDLGYEDKGREVEAKIEDFKDCPRYMAAYMEGITVEESPAWLKSRLIAVGVRPINNIVDATNYVMLETGQPMHAFDSNLAAGQGDKSLIFVRRAKAGEKVITLDGSERELKDSDLVIANSREAIGIAGVMGAQNSEIGSDTSSIILEAANFDPILIRRTAKRLNLRTDAAARFEKSLDPNFCEIALCRAVSLIREMCPSAKLAAPISDAMSFSLNQGPIEFEKKWLEGLIGTNIPEAQAEKILLDLGFTVEASRGRYRVTVPTWRATKDISLKEDIAEEIARIYGYDNIPPQRPVIALGEAEASLERRTINRLKSILSQTCRLNEVYNYSFVGENHIKKLGLDPDSYIRLKNPLSSDQGLLRQSLAPNMLLNAVLNQSRFERFGLFEIGSVFLPISGEDSVSDSGQDTLPYQEKRLAVLLAGPEEDIFTRLKTDIAGLFRRFYQDIEFVKTENVPAWADESKGVEVLAGGNSIGWFALVNKTAAKRIGLKKDAVLAEFPIAKISGPAGRLPRFEPVGKFPPAVRDLAFVVDSSVKYKDLHEAIKGFHKYVKEIELFDVYSGSKLGQKKKSLAFHVVYQADKTLTSREVDKMQAGLFKLLEEKFEAKVRDF